VDNVIKVDFSPDSDAKKEAIKNHSVEKMVAAFNAKNKERMEQERREHNAKVKRSYRIT